MAAEGEHGGGCWPPAGEAKDYGGEVGGGDGRHGRGLGEGFGLEEAKNGGEDKLAGRYLWIGEFTEMPSN